MLKKSQIPFLIGSLFLINALIYWRAFLTIEDSQIIFAECARNSGRTSAGINLLLLFMLGHFGLKSIYQDAAKKDSFRILASLFAINHCIHLFFVFNNFQTQHLDYELKMDLHPFFTFVSLLILPLILWFSKRLNAFLYFAVLLHFFNVTYLISQLFQGRYKPVDPAYTHRIGVVIMIASLLYILFRVYKERTMKFALTEKEN